MPKSELAPGTGELIRSYLKAKGQRYGGTAAGAYHFLVMYIQEEYNSAYVPPTRASTSTMFWVMKDNNPRRNGLGLIHYIGSENPQFLTGIARRHPPAHYNLVEEKVDDQAWRDPKLAWQAAFSPSEEDRRFYASRWNKIKQLPRLELVPEVDDDKVERFVLDNRL
jgi:hypothetical protein